MQIAAEKARLLQEQTHLETRFQELQQNQENIPDHKKEIKKLQEEIKIAEGDLAVRDQTTKDLELARQQQAEAKAENPRLFKEMKELEKTRKRPKYSVIA